MPISFPKSISKIIDADQEYLENEYEEDDFSSNNQIETIQDRDQDSELSTKEDRKR